MNEREKNATAPSPDRTEKSTVQQSASIPPNEIISTRLFDAPRSLVFKMWSEPEHLARWWGPKGFTNTFHEFSFKPGGAWRFVMHGPNGTNYKNESIYVEILEPERIVLDHVSAPQFRIHATFTEELGQTRITFRMLFKTIQECESKKHVAVEGNEQNFDRLEVELSRSANSPLCKPEPENS